jgi:hypothetical protein
MNQPLPAKQLKNSQIPNMTKRQPKRDTIAPIQIILLQPMKVQQQAVKPKKKPIEPDAY